MRSNVANTSAGPIEYTLRGNGAVVLSCHGTSSNCYSSELAEPLEEAGFSVLTPSRPGYGRTPISVGRKAADSALAINSLLDTLDIQTCSVLAISGGGPTGIALAANYPQKVQRLILVEARIQPETWENEASYKGQMTFYGPMHGVLWSMLGLISRISPHSMARQTLAMFSSHNPDDSLSKLSASDIDTICRFYRGKSSRQGALNDMTHTVGAEVLQKIEQPTLVVQSREDNAVPFSHAEWALKNIPQAEFCESGITGHFFWVGPDFQRICQRIITFLMN